MRRRSLLPGAWAPRSLALVGLGLVAGQLIVLLVVTASSAAAITCPAGQWAASFYTGTELAGDPAAQRCDAAIAADWSASGPGVGGLGTTNYSVRWTRDFTLTAGSYAVSVTGDDGVRVTIDGQPVADGWGDHGPQTYTASPTLTAGSHTVVVEYYQRAGGALIEFSFSGGDEPAGPGPDCPAGQWAGSYFPNRTLSGAGAGRCSDTIDYTWGEGTPGVDGIGADNFSVRWTRTVSFGDGNVAFTATADDGIRVYLDDTRLIDEWRDQGPSTFTATAPVTAGDHTIRVEYYEHAGGATARLSYTGPAPASCNALQWSARYYANATLSGTASPARCESPLRHLWGNGGPDVAGIPTDGFSARWTRVDRFAAGQITITATADDGVRVYLDNTQVLDGWRDQGPTTYTATPTVTAGPHTIRVEYYERVGGAQIDVSYTGGGDPGPPPPPPPGGCTSDCGGSWQTLPYPSPVRSIHASLLHTGNVLLVAGSGNDLASFNAGTFTSTVWNPTTGAFTAVPVGADLFCSGHAQLPDGRILLAGGTSAYSTATSNYKGMAKSFVFDPIANTYTATNDTPGSGHWYPSLTTLGSGDVLAVGGLDQNAAGSVATEMFDAAQGRWKAPADVPQTFFFWGLYPELKLMTDGRLFYGGVHTFGNAPTPAGSNIYDVATATVTDVTGLRDINLRDQGASVLLPPAQSGRVLTLGGGNGDAGADAVASTDLINLRDADPHWAPGPNLPAAKMYVSAVILPDGKVLETGGGMHLRSDPVHEASLYDPVANTFTPVPADPADRTYHSQAFLLPDGSVAALGNNPLNGSFDLAISIYRPWYMSKPRPAITNAAATFGYGSTQPLTVDGDIGRVTLIRPASVTHQSDPNQRSVDLPVSGSGSAVSVQVPDNPNLLPPGYYMMFAQNTAGVPSVATWVRVG